MTIKRDNLNNLIEWYNARLNKFVFLLIVLVFATLKAIYTPFLNVFITPGIGFVASIILWYVLFSPGNRVLVYVGLATLFVETFSLILSIRVFIDPGSQLLYVLIILSLINYIKKVEK